MSYSWSEATYIQIALDCPLKRDLLRGCPGGVKVVVVKFGFFWLRLLLRVSTLPTTSLAVVGKAKSEISVF